MADFALVLSIISSLLIIFYLIGMIFGGRKKSDDLTITISGRIVTRTFTQTNVVNDMDNEKAFRNTEGRLVDVEPVESEALRTQAKAFIRNMK